MALLWHTQIMTLKAQVILLQRMSVQSSETERRTPRSSQQYYIEGYRGDTHYAERHQPFGIFMNKISVWVERQKLKYF